MQASAVNIARLANKPWLLMLQRLGVDIDDAATKHHLAATFIQLQTAYAETQRYYHTAAHIHACLSWVDTLAEQLQQPDWLRLAFYFHDAVYDSTMADNEAKSAIWAKAFIGKLRFKQGCDNQQIMAEWVNNAIIATADHATANTSVPDDDLNMFLDIDLSILGAKPSIYQPYSQHIRQEYAHVDDVLYRRGRLKVLQHFLAKTRAGIQRIYISDYFFHRLETQARENIAKEMACLSS